MRFYLGTHHSGWLERIPPDIPLFISHRTLRKRKRLPRAVGRWALDSGGFSELSAFGRWTISASDYVAACQRYRDEIGGLDWCATQDWMCEPWIIKKTGLRKVSEHQRRTVDSLLELEALDSSIPWTPVIQGWTGPRDYVDCVELYDRAGVDLRKYPTVGIGSVCRRQGMTEVVEIIRILRNMLGDRLHCFGLKRQGLASHHRLQSSDSMAWSYRARRSPPLKGCTAHKSCSNCMRFAVRWYRETVRRCRPEPLYSLMGIR